MTLLEQYKTSKSNDTGLAFMIDSFVQTSAIPLASATLYLKRQKINASDTEIRSLIDTLAVGFKRARMAGN